MRIRTQLFLGTASLALALVGLQWWLQSRQLAALESELTVVAAAVGEGVLLGLRPPFAPHGFSSGYSFSTDAGPEPQATPPPGQVLVRKMLVVGSASTEPHEGRRFELRVEAGEEPRDKILVVSSAQLGESRVRIPLEGAVGTVQSTSRGILGASLLLLLAGLAAAAVFAHRVTAPLRRLSAAADELGRGGLGLQIARTARGEVGELQAAFNAMSARLAELEAEREAWRAREHLAELGGLARGLGHTLRNPLHTLGLVVDELASGSARPELSETARTQIRRIDRWLRSFLSLGAGQSAVAAPVDLADLLGDVALEACQQGAPVEMDLAAGPAPVLAVAPAVRAALANLLGNAVEASPPGSAVTVSLRREAGMALVRVSDSGPGLPAEVRERLFAPHVTTKPEGSGMGLYLARQLVEGNGGRLQLLSAPGGGTLALVTLPLHEQGAAS
jgi:signal transduction histidine kinase